jgi:hypothetical protein
VLLSSRRSGVWVNRRHEEADVNRQGSEPPDLDPILAELGARMATQVASAAAQTPLARSVAQASAEVADQLRQMLAAQLEPLRQGLARVAAQWTRQWEELATRLVAFEASRRELSAILIPRGWLPRLQGGGDWSPPRRSSPFLSLA